MSELKWPAIDCALHAKTHDELCDILSNEGYSEENVVMASVGIWGGLQAKHNELNSEITALKSEVARLKVKVEVATEMIREAIEPDFELNESWIGRAGEFGVEQCY